MRSDSSRLAMNAPNASDTARRMRPMLGTFVEIGFEAGATDARVGFERAFAAIEQIEQCLSFHNPESELSQVNRSAGEPVCVSPLTIRVLRVGLALSLASGGLFNYTVGGALVRRGLLPDHGGPSPLDCGTAADVEIKGCAVRLARPVRITLDGIAKGYAVDSAIMALQRQGICAGWINAGGDVRAFGAVTLPIFRRECDGSLRSLGGLRDGAVATSVVRRDADESFASAIFASDGSRANLGAWTVLAHKAWRADALTKVAALAPASLRATLVSRLGGSLIAAPETLH